jgi:glutaredoxin
MENREEETSVPPVPPQYIIYSKSGCPYCTKAKDLLNEKQREEGTSAASAFSFVDIDCDNYLKTPEDKETFLKQMEIHCGKSYRTFPMIFNKASFIGGYTDLVVYLNRLNAIDDIQSAFAEFI